MTPTQEPRPRLARFLPFALYAVILLVFLKISWMRWGDLIIDSGYEWYVPSRILKGEVLYRDLAWLYGPFTPYWNALLMAVGGVHLGSLVISGILAILLTVVPLHFLGARLLGERLAGLTVAVFLCVLAFGFYISPNNYNYIFPYSSAATYGMAFALWSLLFFGRSLEGRGNEKWGVLGLTLTALTRWDLALILALSMVAATWDPGAGRSGPNQFKKTLSFLLPAAGITFLFYVLLLFGPFSGGARTLAAIRSHTSLTQPFARGLMGSDDLGDNLMGLMVTLGLYALFYLFFVAGGRAVQAIEKGNEGRRTWALKAFIGAVVAVPVVLLFENLFGPAAQYRCLPLLSLYLAWRSWKKGRSSPSPGASLWTSLCLFSFLALVRILFKATPLQYGFTLLVPGLLVYHGFFFNEIPSRVPMGTVRNFLKGGALFLVLLFAGTNVLTEAGWYEKRTFPIETSRGSLSFFPVEPAPGCSKLLEFLRQDSAAGDTMAVFPEGAGLNFLSGLPNPVADTFYDPLDLGSKEAQGRIMDGLEKKKVTYVVLLQRDMSEYGRAAFGIDYAKDLMGYVFTHYSPIQQFGPFPYTTQFFGMVLLKRHSDQEQVR